MKRMRPLLGTFVEIAAVSAKGPAPAQRLQAAMDAAFSAIEKVHKLMSFHCPDSDLSRLNLTPPGRDIELHPYTLRVLRLARSMSQASGGLFNCTLGGTLVRRGRLPDHGFGNPLACGGADDIHIDNGRVRRNRNVCITLDGIAKGFAVDVAVCQLRYRGVTEGWVNAGGDIRAFGGNGLPLVRREMDNSLADLGILRNGAVASSGVGAKDKSRFPGYIVSTNDSNTATPAPGVWTIQSTSAWRADALTKVACLSAENKRRETLQKLGGRLLAPADTSTGFQL